ncbi:MAG: transglycosylase domain-containing protein [Actinomycetota bacterium]
MKSAAFIRTFIVIVVVGGFSVGACLAAVIPGAQVIGTAHYYTGEIKTLGELSQRTTVFDANGAQIGVLGTQDRQPVKFEEIPKPLINAVIAIEDKTFWENPGVDVGGVFRAFVENVTSGEIEQGGSTITQQLVKNRVLGAERDLDRKVREVVLAYRLNDQYTKKEIITQYLNTVYFGQGSYGIKSASERFFLKPDMASLTVGEAALLAGVIANPEGDNPFVYPDKAIERRSDVLKQEVRQGFITQEQADAANLEPLPTVKPPAELRPSNDFVEEVQARLLADERLGATEKERRNALLQGGLTVHTTLDPTMQAQAEEAVNAITPEKPGFTASLVAMDPKTGHVKAMMKGSGFSDSQFNIITDGIGRQMGSTWKVITLATILANNYSANDMVDGTSPCMVKGYGGRTQNAEGGGGFMTIRAAAANSVNCAFVRMSTSVGLPEVIAMAHKLGIRTDDPDQLIEILTLTLGTIESTPLEMVTVDSTLASGGVRHDPIFVSKVLNAKGEIVFDDTAPPGERVLEPDVAACAVDILHGPLSGGGTASGKAPRGHDAFGKTGTTDERTNAAFLGGTMGLTAFVWHGAPEGNIPGAGFGGQVPATIWNRFMNNALAGKPDEKFPAPGPQCKAPGQFVNPEGGRVDLAGLLPPASTLPADTTPTTPTTAPPGPAPTAPAPTVPTVPVTTSPPPPSST